MLKRADQPYQVLPDPPSWEYQALKESIRRYGVLLPVVKDEQGKTIDGHHREQACEELGIKDYPIITLHGLSEEQEAGPCSSSDLVRRKVTRKQLREMHRCRTSPHARHFEQLAGRAPRHDAKSTVNSVRRN